MTQPVTMYPGVGTQYGADIPQHYYPAYPTYASDYQQQPYVQQQQYLQQQYPQQPMYDYAIMQRWFDYKNDKWIKGAIVGVAVTLVLTNTTVQKTIAKGVLGVWGTLQSGVEEFKEQIHDIQAESNEKSV